VQSEETSCFEEKDEAPSFSEEIEAKRLLLIGLWQRAQI
jgi:hypothetical protein